MFEQSIRFTVNHVHIDDAGFGLGQLHDSIAERYRYALVPPCPDGRLFEPRIGDAAYIDAGYMMQPGTMATLRDIGVKLLGSDLSACRRHEMLVEWHAEQETLESGTAFRMPIGPTLNSGMEVSIVWPDKTCTSATIVTANRQEIVIKMEKSGLCWQMTPRTEADAPINIKLNLPTEDWTVRDQKV
jgi:hypothetical protein